LGVVFLVIDYIVIAGMFVLAHQMSPTSQKVTLFEKIFFAPVFLIILTIIVGSSLFKSK